MWNMISTVATKIGNQTSCQSFRRHKIVAKKIDTKSLMMVMIFKFQIQTSKEIFVLEFNSWNAPADQMRLHTICSQTFPPQPTIVLLCN